MIEVNHLSKVFEDYKRGPVSAVDDISFTCNPGEIFGLLGPNGAGKTTTLRMLSTVLRPSSGQALIAGHDVVREPQKVRENIGFMSNATAIYDRMTAWETVEFFGRLNGMPRPLLKQRMEEIFEWLQMNSFRDMLGGKLSTGMKQKVSIARTIVHDPPVLIFDEPTSGLDVLVSRVLLQKIRELRERGKTIILSTHSMHEVNRLCQRVGIIHRGRLQALGTINDLLSEHGQSDLEELFFHLVDKADAAASQPVEA